MSHALTNEIAAIAVFLISYVVISARRLPFVKLNRPAASVTGAVLMIVATDLTFDRAVRHCVNWDTIALLLGMMILVAYLRMARFFDLAAWWLLHAARRPTTLLWLLVFVSGLLSALFVNDTICVLFTPVVLLVILRSRMAPVPFLMAIATGSNVGSVVTFTGNPQNMLIGTELVRLHPQWSFARFTLLMAPIGLGGLVIAAAVLSRVYRAELRTGAAVAGETLARPRVNGRLIRKCMIVLALVLAGFVAWPRSLPLVAMAGASILLCWSRRKPEKVFARVDWTLLLFFAALFVLIGGVDESGLVEQLHGRVTPLFRGDARGEVAVFSAVSVALSQLLSNVPYVLVAGKWVEGFHRPDLGWLTLAMASTLAGNLTIFGSVANLIVVELAKKEAPISFWEYCRAGVPITILTVLLGMGVMTAYFWWLPA